MARRCVLIAIALFAGCKSQNVAKPTPTTFAGVRLWAARDVGGYDPHRVIALSLAPESKWEGDDLGSEHYRDIMSHTPPRVRWTKAGAAPTTIAHETHHGLQSYNSNEAGEDVKFFYFERGFGALVPRPKQSLRLLRTEAGGVNVYAEDAKTSSPMVRQQVPDSVKKLAKLRYELYLTDPERETYGVLALFNEWNAYIASARVAVELWEAKQYYEESRGASSDDSIRRIGELDGMVDLMYFSAAGIAALKQNEPEYLQNNEQLRAVFAVFAEDTMKWVHTGGLIPLFSGFHADELREHFARSPDAAHIRDVLREWLGSEWTSRVLNFE